VVRIGKLEATSEEVKALHLDALSEARMHADEGVASAAGAGLRTRAIYQSASTLFTYTAQAATLLGNLFG
jgi:hypothetical protein